jgi:hypothetical protein
MDDGKPSRPSRQGRRPASGRRRTSERWIRPGRGSARPATVPRFSASAADGRSR